MSKVVDEKVVEMQFNNKNFEKNVSQSMSTLDKLKEKLKLPGASKALEEVNNKAQKINLTPIEKAVETIEVKFSAMSVAAYTAINRITNYAITAGKNLVKSLSTDNIMAGWNKLQEKGKSMSTLISQGFKTDDVEEQLDKLLWFTDETSYNFTDMIGNIAKFTATGKDLKSSVTAMQGIALWAAKSGQNAQTASAAMYQLSQALGAGVMRKEDWKSIQNANMDTKEFRQTAIDTAIQLKTLKKVGKDTYQSLKGNKKKFNVSQFADYLTEGQWFTSDVMMKVYQKYAKASDQMYNIIEKMGDEKLPDDKRITLQAGKIIEAYDAIKDNKWDEFLKDSELDSYSKEATDNLKEMVSKLDDFSVSTFRAGQEYRSFGDAIDATKDAVSTKWMQIFESLIGNIDAQKDLYSQIGEWFYEKFAAPLDNLQDLLNVWIDKGGRDNLWEGIRNITGALGEFLKPIKEAFREIFPKTTAQDLLDFTEKFKNFTAKLKPTEETVNNLKDIFKSLFSVLKFGVDIIKTVIKALTKIGAAFIKVGKNILSIFSIIGKLVEVLIDFVKKTGIITNTLNIIATTIEKALTLLGDFITKWLRLDKVIGVFKRLIQIIKLIGDSIADVVRSIINDGTAKQGAQLFNTGVIGYILLNGAKLINWLKKFTSNFTETVNKTTKLFEQLGGILDSWQKNLDSKTLLKIAEAVLILVVALKILSGIDPSKLGSALAAMGVAMLELMGSFKLFATIMNKQKGSVKNTFGIIGMAIALLIASKAIKDLSELSWDEILRGLSAMAGAMAILIATTRLMGKTKSSWFGIYKEKKSLLGMAVTLVIIAKAMQMFAKLSWDDVIRSLISMTSAFVILISVTKAMSNKKFKKADTAKSLVMISSIILLAKGMQMLAKLSWDDVARSLVAMGGAMTILSLVVTHMGNTSKTKGINKERKNLIAMTASLITLAKGMQMLAKLTWDDIGRSLVAMGGAMAILTASIALFRKVKKKDNMGLIMATASLILLGKGLKSIAGLSWGDTAKSLITMAGAFLILAKASKHLKPVGNILLKIGAGIALIGVGATIIGIGLLLISSGIAALVASLGGSLSIIIGAITAIILSILDLVPEIVLAIGRLIVALCDVIIEAAPKIAKTIMVVIYEVIKELADYLPLIVKELIVGIIEILRMIANHLPELIVAAVEVVQAFFKGFIQALKILDKNVLIEGIKAVGMITVILLLMATLAALAPAALVGILAFGVLVTELAIVLGIIGKILGHMNIDNLVKVGNILEQIGLAIGKFIGGIIGGVAHAVTSVLPNIATNLSDFATNIVPFLDIIRFNIDSSLLKNVGILSAALVLLTESGFIASIISFISGKNALPELGKQLSDFMENISPFLAEAYSINPTIVKNVKTLAEAIKTICAASLLNRLTSFGSWITGESSITKFGKDLVKMAEYLNEFNKKLGTFGESEVKTIDSASEAIKRLATVSKDIPRTGGLWSWLAGDNSLAKFGKALPEVGNNIKNFVTNLGEFSTPQIDTVKAAGQAIKELADASTKIPNSGGIWGWIAGDNSLGDFSEYLPDLGTDLSEFVTNLGSFTSDQVDAVKAAGESVRALAEASSKIPRTGGIWSWIAGDNSLGKFSKYLPGLGSDLKDFLSNLTKDGGFQESQVSTVKAAGECLIALAEASSKLPRSGGWIEKIVGSADIGKFADKLPDVGKNIKGFADGFKELEEGDLNKVKIGAESIAAMANASGNIPADRPQWLKDLIGDPSISTFADKLPTVGEGVAGFAKAMKEGGIDDGSVKLAESGANVIAALATAAEKVPTDRSDWLKTLIGNNNIDEFASKFPKAAEGIAGFIAKLKEYKFANGDVEMAESGAKVIQILAEASSKIDSTGGITSLWSGDQDLEKFATGFPQIGEGIAGFIEKVKGLGEDQISSVNAALKVVETFSTLDGKDLSKLSGNLDDLRLAVVNFGNYVSLFVTDMSKITQEDIDSSISKVQQILDFCQKSIEIDPEKLKSFGESLVNIGKNAIDAFKDSMSDSNAANTAAEGVRLLIDNIKDSLDAKRQDLADKVKDLISSAISTLSDRKVYNDAHTAGENFAIGFADGINDKKYLSVEAGTKLGNAAYEAARKAIDSHSPSKKAHQLGNFFGAGFVNGISEYTKTAYTESYSMAEEASNGLSSAIAKISDMIDGNIDSQPTIRPVLDLSDIQNKAGQIGNMFDNVNVGANINAISKGMNNRNQNGNAEVVSAIDKLGKGLGNGGNTYNFNGISYSDNKEISNAIEVLLRAANVERRI